uniref:Protein CHUP1, chloroplastic n=1 Tax=Noccaea caerulescens TaxID=107243 RepID=A0A1J3IHP7_NOCCA
MMRLKIFYLVRLSFHCILIIIAWRKQRNRGDMRARWLISYNDSELERLGQLVKELEERKVKLEGELIDYYGLKEQESDIVEFQRQLKIKTVEIDMLNITINSLQAERKKY